MTSSHLRAPLFLSLPLAAFLGVFPLSPGLALAQLNLGSLCGGPV